MQVCACEHTCVALIFVATDILFGQMTISEPIPPEEKRNVTVETHKESLKCHVLRVSYQSALHTSDLSEVVQE